MVGGCLSATRRPPWCVVLHTMRRTVITGAVLALLPLVPQPAAAEPPVRLLGEQTLPFGMEFQATTVGGLSGIDRDPRTGGYVLICDDRSDKQPARFYTADIDVDEHGLGEVRLTGTHPFLRQDATTYPAGTVDPEDIRVDPLTGKYFWSQEGERILDPELLIDPSIEVTRSGGDHVRTLPLPPVERMSATEHGPRQNQGLEALTFADGGTLVVSAVEGALWQDGPEGTAQHGTTSRITVQTRFGHLLAQYAYPQEPVFAEPDPPGAFATTGVAAILAADHGRYLVLERSFVTGVGNKIRIFEVDPRGATDIAGMDSIAGETVRPVDKRLLADLADFDLSTVDNVEGMTWGPRLRTGERTLLLVSDDNFAASQTTQVIALAVR